MPTPIPLSLLSGQYVFKAVDRQGNEVYLRDVLNRPKLLPLPVLRSPDNNSTLQTTTPTFVWDPADGAKMYSVQMEEEVSPNTWGRMFIGVWTYGTTYDLPSGYLTPGARYRWRVRANDGDSVGTVDNRSVSVYRYFTVQEP